MEKREESLIIVLYWELELHGNQPVRHQTDFFVYIKSNNPETANITFVCTGEKRSTSHLAIAVFWSLKK